MAKKRRDKSTVRGEPPVSGEKLEFGYHLHRKRGRKMCPPGRMDHEPEFAASIFEQW